MIQNDLSIIMTKEFGEFLKERAKNSPHKHIWDQVFKAAADKGFKAEFTLEIEMALKVNLLSISDELFELLEKNMDDMHLKEALLNMLILDGKNMNKIAEIILNEFKLNSSRKDFTVRENLYLWALGDDLYRLSLKKYHKDYLDIVNQKNFGDARQMVIRMLRLKKFRTPETLSVFLNNLDDDSINGHVLDALSKFDFPEKREIAERFLLDERKWVAKIAKKMLS